MAPEAPVSPFIRVGRGFFFEGSSVEYKDEMCLDKLM